MFVAFTPTVVTPTIARSILSSEMYWPLKARFDDPRHAGGYRHFVKFILFGSCHHPKSGPRVDQVTGPLQAPPCGQVTQFQFFDGSFTNRLSRYCSFVQSSGLFQLRSRHPGDPFLSLIAHFTFYLCQA